MVPPSPWPDFVLAGIVLAWSSWWTLCVRRSTAGTRSSQAITVGALLCVCGLLYATLLRFGFFDALLPNRATFGYGPFWRVSPAIAASVTSAILLLSALRQQST